MASGGVSLCENLTLQKCKFFADPQTEPTHQKKPVSMRTLSRKQFLFAFTGSFFCDSIGTSEYENIRLANNYSRIPKGSMPQTPDGSGNHSPVIRLESTSRFGII
ncbi:MAG: hypothetical protein J6A48_05905 [Clostridia bacterium]|nr:hypothetical protein [Clostridia bacterium]